MRKAEIEELLADTQGTAAFWKSSFEDAIKQRDEAREMLGNLKQLLQVGLETRKWCVIQGNGNTARAQAIYDWVTEAPKSPAESAEQPAAE